MNQLTKLTIAQARDKLAAKEISAHELVSAHIKSSEENRHLNAFITETFEQALIEAQESDQRRKNSPAGLMDGIPIGIKDLYCTKNVRTTAASKALENFIPPYESTVTQKLRGAGAISLGKCNLDEFAMGSANATSAFGPVISPIKAKNSDENLVPGGSSGGSAAAVAAEMVMAATGTDTGGSIRQPAAFCGIVGIKPTYGRCSRYGVIAFASSLDQAGPMTKTVQDAAIMLQAMAGYDPKDSTSINVPVPCYEKALTGEVKGLRIGIPKEYQVDSLSPDIMKMWENGRKWLEEHGATVHEISLKHTKYALPTYYVLAPAEASSNLARYDGLRYSSRVNASTLDEMYELSRAQGFGHEVKRRILMGTYVLSAGYYDAYFLKAQKVRTIIANEFTDAFKEVDLILAPSAPSGAFALNYTPSDPVEMYLNDVLTVPANLAGLPAISVPAALTQDGRPLGLQLIGPALSESTIFRAAGVIETCANFQTLNQMVV